MAKILVIKAHPQTIKKSRTLLTLDRFLTAYQAANPADEIEVRDLYAENFPDLNADLMNAFTKLGQHATFSDLNDATQHALAAYNATTQQFIDADKLIIANPMWNLNIPAKLKAWIDTICVAGKTFKYTETGAIALHPGKKVLHIQSAGGKYAGQDFGSQYIRGIMGFLGASDIQDLDVEGMDHFPDQADAIIAAGLADAEKLAKTF